jgi:hypothetical protein
MLTDHSELTASAAHISSCASSCSHRTKKQLALDARRIQESARRMDVAITQRGWSKAPGYVFKGVKSKVLLVCDQGHITSKQAYDFMQGVGCRTCANSCPDAAESKLLTTLMRRKWCQGVGYVYKGTSTPVAVVCNHGHAIMITPNSINSQGSGCRVCNRNCTIDATARFESTLKQRGWTKSPDFVAARYDTPVALICLAGHSVLLSQHHFMQGIGCCKCKKLCPEQAKADFDVQIVDRGWKKAATYVYKGSVTAVDLICPVGHSARVKPNNFKSAHGCRSCCGSGFNRNKPATLYYVAFFVSPERVVYKIGVTNNTVAQRYVGCTTAREIIWERYFESGAAALRAEAQIKVQFKQYRCKDAPIAGLGNHELFEWDVLPKPPRF